jgi:hypothetical protein
MINYYFFHYKKKFGPDRTVPWRSDPRGPTVGRVRVFRIRWLRHINTFINVAIEKYGLNVNMM